MNISYHKVRKFPQRWRSHCYNAFITDYTEAEREKLAQYIEKITDGDPQGRLNRAPLTKVTLDMRIPDFIVMTVDGLDRPVDPSWHIGSALKDAGFTITEVRV